MRVLLLCLSCLLTSVHGLYEQLFQIDLEGLLKDETRMKALFECLIDRGSCKNFQIIKDIAPKIFLNKCEGCTAEQKEIFYKAVYNLAQKYAKVFTELTQSHPLRGGQSSGLDKQTEELLNVDFTRLLMDKNHSKALVDCLVDRGSCEHYQYIKETVPKVVKNKCKGCTAEQKEVFDWTIQLATKLYPEEFAQFTESLEKTPSLTEAEEELLKMDFTSLSTNKDEMHEFLNCLIDRGPCEKFPAFQIAGPKLLLKKCEICNPEQKEKFVDVMKQFADKYPKAYEDLALKVYPRKVEYK